MIFFTKSILSLILLGMGILNMIVMLQILGRTGEKKSDPKRLRMIHRVNGYLFILFFLVISYICIKIMRGMGQDLNPRAALHATIASATFFLLCFKILIVRHYKKYYSMGVPMGIGVVLLLLVTTATSAGYYFSMRGTGSFVPGMQEGLVKEGATVFNEKGCGDCHYADRRDSKIGPGLKDLFSLEKFTASGLPVTEENLRKQITAPFRAMPSYSGLSEKEMEALVAFLKERLADYKVPRRIMVLDHLPRTPTGKVLKTKLRELST